MTNRRMGKMNLVILTTLFTVGWCYPREEYHVTSTDVNKIVDTIEKWTKDDIGVLLMNFTLNGTSYEVGLRKTKSTFILYLDRKGRLGPLSAEASYANKTILIGNSNTGMAIALSDHYAMIIKEGARFYLVCAFWFFRPTTISPLKADDFVKLNSTEGDTKYDKLISYIRKITQEEVTKGQNGTIDLTTLTDAVVQDDRKKLAEFLEEDVIDDVVSNYKDFFKNGPGDSFRGFLRVLFEDKLSPVVSDLGSIIEMFTIADQEGKPLIKEYVRKLFGDNFPEPIQLSTVLRSGGR